MLTTAAIQNIPERVSCPQCDHSARIVELRAFGVDRHRSTLSCGHVVTRDSIVLDVN